MPDSEDFSAFEEQVADVPNVFDELPGVQVSKNLVAHLEDLLAHFITHVTEHIVLANMLGQDTIHYPVGDGTMIAVTASDLEVTIRYTIPQDLADETRRQWDQQEDPS